MKKTERQNGIVHLLRTRSKMTAKELANYYEVSERTIYRDIDALCQLHVPIIAYEGMGGGYEIDPSFFMPSIKLNEQEILMLMMVLKAGEELRIPNMTKDYHLLNSKVINVLSDEERKKAEDIISHIEFDLIRIKPRGYIQDVITLLLEAFKKCCDLQIIYYHPERDQTETRRFSPIKLYFAEGGWYVKGFCHMRKAKRTFRLDRIVSLICLNEENLYRNSQLSLPEQDKFKWDTYELIIDPALYRIIKEDDYLQHSVIKSVEGGLQLTINTPYKNEIRQLVLNHPEQVTALKPEEFIREIEELGRAIYKKYLEP